MRNVIRYALFVSVATLVAGVLYGRPRTGTATAAAAPVHGAAQYVLRETPGGVTAVNAAQSLRARWSGGALELRPKEGDAWTLRQRFVGMGRGERPEEARGVEEQKVTARRIEWTRGEVVEWYVNGTAGIEQGFTIRKKPAGRPGEALVLESRVLGLAPRVDDSGDALSLISSAGDAALRLKHPAAFDAKGKSVPVRFAALNDRIRLLVDDEHAEYPLVVDPLYTTPAWTAESDQAGAEFGWSVAGAGDVNADGYKDVIVGAWKYDGQFVDGGKAYLYLGSASGLGANAAWTAEGSAAGAWFGWSVAGAGDVNGDGKSDVLVGAMGGVGKAYLYIGTSSGLSSTPWWSGQGPTAGSEYGAVVTGAGNLDGDAFADFAIAAPRQVAANGRGGVVSVYYGSASAPVLGAAFGPTSGMSFGASVAGAGDVNGDGRADLLVGDPHLLLSGAPTGTAYLYYGKANRVFGTAAWSYVVTGQGEGQLGVAVAPAGNVNGDAYADIILGAPSVPGAVDQEGKVFVFRGSSTGPKASTLWTVTGTTPYQQLGQSVASAGDVDHDGFGDVVIGAWSHDGDLAREGQAVMYRGSSTGLVAQSAWVVEGDQSHAELGACVAAAGDVDGDLYGDVVVGLWGFDGGQTNEGRVQLYRGYESGAGGQSFQGGGGGP